MVKKKVSFYFDVISPFCYVAWQRLQALDVVLEPKAVVFAGLLNHHGNIGPAEVSRFLTF